LANSLPHLSSKRRDPSFSFSAERGLKIYLKQILFLIRILRFLARKPGEPGTAQERGGVWAEREEDRLSR